MPEPIYTTVPDALYMSTKNAGENMCPRLIKTEDPYKIVTERNAK